MRQEHVARKVDTLRHYYHARISDMFDDALRLSHRIAAFAAGPPPFRGPA